ncbi:MAG: hypothetical protein KKB35_06320, partial [Proteobacteria bacterium]|nr:hypothetical protein [Pseudomonadota bacterium]
QIQAVKTFEPVLVVIYLFFQGLQPSGDERSRGNGVKSAVRAFCPAEGYVDIETVFLISVHQ